MRVFPLILLTLLAFSSCKQKKKTTKAPEMETIETTMPSLPVSIDKEKYAQDSDPLNIKSAKMNGDILELIVSFSGGCEEHDFELVSNGFYMKSLPPKLAVKVMHNSNQDACRSLIEKPLSFNIKDLRYPGDGPLILIVDGMKEETTYRY
ncbi:MAG: hypothetical protein ACPGED_04520 [Flavobacteriales bacterium]